MARHARRKNPAARRAQCQDQPVQRRVGEHQPMSRSNWRDARGDHPAASGQHDRPGPMREQRALGRANLSETLGGGAIGDHDGEGLCVARLAPAEVCDRRLVTRVAEPGAKPPRPFSATIPPSRNKLATSAIGTLSFGPQRGQAIGSAWKRRFDGSA